MMATGTIIFLLMVFATVVLLTTGLTVPVFGEGGKMRKRLKQRMDELDAEGGEAKISSLLRDKYMRSLTPLERSLESLPSMDGLRRMIDQAGYTILAHRLVGISIICAAAGGAIVWFLTHMLLAAAAASLAGAALPIMKVWKARNERMMKFEEQLPDAIDSMRRALKAGHPFGATLKLVAEDMEDPIAREFELTFADLNYGNDIRRAMLGLLQRVPSLTVMALVTSVLVQKETGGNLAEILEQISKVIRGRFRFYRRVKTLSAEGRLSGWILALIPFLLFAMLMITTPTYLPVLLESPTGQKMIMVGGIAGFIGILWIRRIIRVEV
jgi:tight adherence protein B